MALLSAKLTTLPPEILLSVASSLDGRDLSALSQTCKRFYRLTLRDLYKSIRCQSSAQIILLLRAFLDNPRLGELVEQFHGTGNPNSKDQRDLDAPSLLTKVEVSNAVDRVRQLRLRTTDGWGWETMIERGNMSAYMALALTYMLRIKSLRLEGKLVQDTRFFNALLDPALSSPPFSIPGKISNRSSRKSSSLYLSRLSRVYLAPSGNDDTSTEDLPSKKRFPCAEELLTSLYLPQLQHACLKLPVPRRDFQPSFLNPCMNTLTELHLPYSKASPAVLADVLSSSSFNLKVLKYSYSLVRTRARLDMVSLSRAIAAVSSTLEVLALHAIVDESTWPYDDGQYPFEELPTVYFDGDLEGLDECENLKDLAVEIKMLPNLYVSDNVPKIGFALPENLEVLRLSDRGDHVSGRYCAVLHFLAGIRMWTHEKEVLGKTPEWVELEVDAPLFSNWQVENMRQLTDSCDSADIRASIHDFAYRPWQDVEEEWIMPSSRSGEEVCQSKHRVRSLEGSQSLPLQPARGKKSFGD